MDRQRGIRKPRELDAALSIRPSTPSRVACDRTRTRSGPDDLLRYKWRGDDPNHAENRALREAMLREVPLIWFCGVGQGVYRPVFPVFLLWEEREQHQFVLDPDIAHGLVDRETPVTEHLRRYIRRETWQRLHQPVFRATVLRAYDTRCAVCALRHHQLLDAAHIVADREEAGIAAVRNGLALCKIHHAAYDCHVLGIRPDLVVEIRADLLAEVDGPMLGARSQGSARAAADGPPQGPRRTPRPRELLDRRYAAFRTAG